MRKQNLLFWLIVVVILSVRIYLYRTSPKIYTDGDRVRITTSIRTEPIRYENYQYIKLENLKIYLPLYPEITYGDQVIIEGIVNSDKLEEAGLVELKESHNFAYRFRQELLSFYRKSLPEPYSSLIAGVTIGSKSGIPSDFWEKLKNSGTAHVVVASGMNVTLVAGFLLNFLVILMKRKKALLFTLFGIWFYAVLTGFDAPIIRAAVMGSIAFTSQEFGRLNMALRSLLYSAVVMLLINPDYIQDVGFLLSFFATLGLICFEPKIENLISKKIKIFAGRGTIAMTIRTDFSTTLAAQIAVFPILYHFFGSFNLFSPLVNTLILWTIVPITILGMIGGVVGLIIPILGRGLLLLTYPLTLWFVKIVDLFG